MVDEYAMVATDKAAITRAGLMARMDVQSLISLLQTQRRTRPQKQGTVLC